MSVQRSPLQATVLAIALLSLYACDNQAEPLAEGAEQALYRLDDNGVAIDGYSPVSYFQRGKAETGSAEFAVEHQGVTYYLTDAEQVALFESDPDRYRPAHGGWCSLMLSGSGKLLAANPQAFKIVNDRLLIFWAGDFKGQYIDGTANWESQAKGDDMKLLAKSDKTWHRYASGKKDPEYITIEELAKNN